VKFTIDKNYTVDATGVLQNTGMGRGYAPPGHKPMRIEGNTITWHFIGKNIHDFVIAADDQYKQVSKKVRNDLTLRVFYKAKNATTDSAWNNILWMAEKVLPVIEKRFGKYPWLEYAFIQGGDGGMEYAMATLINKPSIETAVHEWMHSWYQHLLATNESLYPWMDEGFTTFAEDVVMDYYRKTWANQSPYIHLYTRHH
jgi:hypothetical protein